MLASFYVRSDLNLYEGDRSYELLVQDYIEFLLLVLYKNSKLIIVSPLFYSIFIIIVMFSLINLRNWKLSFISSWIIAVFLFAVVSKGYTYYGVDFRVHRATVIFPVLFTMMFIMAKEIELRWQSAKLFLIFLIIIFYTYGLYFRAIDLDSRPLKKHYYLLSWIEEVGKKNNIKIDELYFDLGDDHLAFQSIYDASIYFAPNIVMHSFEEKNCPKNFTIFKSENKKSYLIINKTEKDKNCFEGNNFSLKYIDQYKEIYSLYEVIK